MSRPREAGQEILAAVKRSCRQMALGGVRRSFTARLMISLR
jgi:hypothetical protein